MNLRYQHGHVRCRKRKNATTCWEFMWREEDPSGKRVRRTSMIGTIENYPTKELARAAVMVCAYASMKNETVNKITQSK